MFSNEAKASGGNGSDLPNQPILVGSVLSGGSRYNVVNGVGEEAEGIINGVDEKLKESSMGSVGVGEKAEENPEEEPAAMKQKEDKDSEEKGVPEFWLTAMKKKNNKLGETGLKLVVWVFEVCSGRFGFLVVDFDSSKFNVFYAEIFEDPRRKYQVASRKKTRKLQVPQVDERKEVVENKQ
ncbi:Nucleosome assembly protein (NAP) [Corchorus capsularis]|uniref:Nucleosome assembly protein (NAP) n=1 Tax=Corchorus capsularis TaxID=210143 RepID=A0A1R3JG57_COCAP|nr:Nucleosome assembly protein (NAP) [Corchorus capsularis]